MSQSSILDNIGRMTNEVFDADRASNNKKLRKIIQAVKPEDWSVFTVKSQKYLKQVKQAVDTRKPLPLPEDWVEPVATDVVVDDADDDVELHIDFEAAMEEAAALKRKKALADKTPAMVNPKDEPEVEGDDDDYDELDSKYVGIEIVTEKNHVVMSVDGVLSMLKSGNLRVPDFQRKPIWSKQIREAYIKYFMQGLSTDEFVFTIDPDTNVRNIIDGLQRVTTLQAFLDNKVLLDGKRFNQLSQSMQNKFLFNTVLTTQIKADRKYWPMIFRCRNKGGAPLRDMEVRRATYQHDLLSMLDTFADNNEIFGGLFGKNNRFQGLEALTRAVAMHVTHREYQKPVTRYLDGFCDDLVRGAFNDDERMDCPLLQARLDRIIDAINETIGRSAFRLAESKPINLGLLDCMIHCGLTVLEGNDLISIKVLGQIINDVREKLLADGPTGPAWLSMTHDTSGKAACSTRMKLTEQYTTEAVRNFSTAKVA